MTEKVAGKGLLHRRGLLKATGAGLTGGILMPIMSPVQAAQEWLTKSGVPMDEYGAPSRFAQLKRVKIGGHPYAPGAGSSSTPLESLNGTITPNSLHFERHHSGIPDIDPAQHTLTIYGDVNKKLQFSYEDLLAYPMETHTYFLECSGNSYTNAIFPDAADKTVSELNGLVSCSEWTGVPLHYLLDEAGVKPGANWVVGEGADAASLTRSIPMKLATKNVMVALYQNGEPLRPAQGYPMRLFVPGSEGNISVKWLRNLKVQKTAAYTRDETSKYSDLHEDGKADLFSFEMGVKSLITSPSGKMALNRKGVYEISGIAWSGAGGIKQVEVSADGGKSWAIAALQSENRALSLMRFRIPWRWEGQSAVLQSRATDDSGHVQPSRSTALSKYAKSNIYHFNGTQSWQVSNEGRVKNVYA
jgi:sulfane dehydrogenase subunit SoxC